MGLNPAAARGWYVWRNVKPPNFQMEDAAPPRLKVWVSAAKNDEKNCDACGGNFIQRADDSPEILEKRITTYEERTEPIIAYYREKGKVKDIDGQPSIEIVTSEIEKVI